MIFETERLYLREMEQSDFEGLCKILKDEETMYAYEGAFNDTEVQEWLDKQLSRYHKYGFGLWAVVLKETGEMIGQCGLTMQQWKNQELLEIGYLFQRLYWHKGYAVEAAKACKKYAFEVLNADEVCSIIRDTNIASQKVAIRNDMVAADTWTKHYRGVDMPHCRYVVRKERNCIMNIRKAKTDDLSRIAEIYVWNNRINYFPIFKDEGFSFGELQVVSLVDHYFRKDEILKTIYVFDDGLIRGFLQMNELEICKLYVDPFFQNKGIGSALMEYAVKQLDANNLWALEKNEKAISFYQRHGFHLTGQKNLKKVQRNIL